MRELLLASTIVAGLMSAVPAVAQTAAPGAAPTPDPSADEQATTVVVTGTRIASPNLASTAPVTQVTGEDIQVAGVTRVEDLVNQLPQVFAAQSSTVSNGSSGTATVNLRGLGASRTLVLIDGRRMSYGSPNEVAADLNQIPSAIVERVEVLTGGASAVYGSDAIAGVVNFIMRKRFTGVQVDVQHSFFQHRNDHDGVGDLRGEIARRATSNPTEFRLPDDNVTDGFGTEVSVILGAQTDDGRGSLMGYAAYVNNGKVLQANRDFSACSIGTAGPSGFTCGGSSTNARGRFFSLANGADLTLETGQAFRAFDPRLDQYNFGPINYFQRPDERYNLGLFGQYEINDSAEAYMQLMFTDSSTVAQIAPSGLFFGSGNGPNGGFFIPCDNPLLSGDQRTELGCSAADVASGEAVEVFVGRRNIEGGGRQDDLNHRSFRAVLGLRGDFADGWSYDLVGQFSSVNLSRTYLNEFSKTRAGRALDVVADPRTGEPVCRSSLPDARGLVLDPNCVPYNVWAVGGVTERQLAYIQIPGVQVGETRQQVVTGTVSGDLGFASPLATERAQVVFGIEYRRDEVSSRPDVAFETDDLFGQGGPTIGLSGSTQSTDFFVETRLDLVEGRPFADLVSLDAAYRRSELSGGRSTDTYTVGLDWAPIESLRFRGSQSRAVRAANVIELFSARQVALFDLDQDPCGPARTATQAQCLATGVPAASYGSVLLDSPAGQYNQLIGGNPDLAPETADTRTLGLVFTPSFVEGLNVSVDWFDIDLSQQISIVDPLITLSQCYENDDAAACARITRSAVGTLWTAGGQVLATNVNIGGLRTSGVDLNATYRFDLERVRVPGAFSLNLAGTWLRTLETDPGVGPSGVFDCVGFYGNQCGTPNPEWRHRARLSWTTPWKLDLSATWRHYGEVELFEGAADRIDRVFEAENYFDLAGSWDARENLTLRAGINNILDNDPPLSASAGTTGNGNTFPQTYDALGRFVFMSATVTF